CYRYALLLDVSSASPDELRPILERVVHLKPDLEDARFRLGLLEENVGRHQEALAQFQAIHAPSPEHAFSYWCSLSQALLGLGRNSDADKAAQEALQKARSAEDRAHAMALQRMARTYPTVQFSRDADGKPVLSMTRAPNEEPHWNAFIEPGDDLKRAEGALREIECGDGGLRMVLETGKGRLVVSIPDPRHVEMRNAPAEFVCGPQEGQKVLMEYAATKGK